MPTYDKEMIARYAEGDLPEEERRQFEAELQRDPSLADELALYREIRATLHERLPADQQREALIATLQQMRPLVAAERGTTPIRSLTPFPAGRLIRMRWIGAVAAACVIGIVALLVWPSSTGDLERLGHTEMVGTTERG